MHAVPVGLCYVTVNTLMGCVLVVLRLLDQEIVGSSLSWVKSMALAGSNLISATLLLGAPQSGKALRKKKHRGTVANVMIHKSKYISIFR